MKLCKDCCHFCWVTYKTLDSEKTSVHCNIIPNLPIEEIEVAQCNKYEYNNFNSGMAEEFIDKENNLIWKIGPVRHMCYYEAIGWVGLLHGKDWRLPYASEFDNLHTIIRPHDVFGLCKNRWIWTKKENEKVSGSLAIMMSPYNTSMFKCTSMLDSVLVAVKKNVTNQKSN